ncbi:transposase [Enterococcus gallinarum]|uniref:Transposase n=1 Tax=Enterococcus gallinarum TaxID=1353 RepID=A0ABD4ZWE9_ENTGA|nr:transposase [Enterococcus gallinarum]MBF0725115.1 transposase [Enterococcus gallinarum]MBX8979312.1 transposase [Enterococcus gallinarum]MCR1932058.1 transposase [Enterococcus gallinarum]MDL4876659.1 transposase [Enterococcus gallinarum]MDL4883013.1 transposase [Enterococcus gallinarum]
MGDNKNNRIKMVSEKIVSHTTLLDKTYEIYNQALTYILKVMFQEFPLTYDESIKTTTNVVEKLIHHTAKNPQPKYEDFNMLFPKYPSYFRRATIASAYGKWSSWRSNYLNWEKERLEAIDNNKKFTKKAPTPQFEHTDFPVFYKGNMYKQIAEGYEIKIYKNNDWVWEKVVVSAKTDLIRRGITDWKQCNPKLIKRGSKYFLSFAYEKEIKLHKLKESDTRILAIDLGLTNSAVCCVMESDGTVLDRLFIKQSKEKDHLFHLTNQLKKAQRQTRGAKCPRYWNRIKGLQRQMTNDTAHQIIEFATKYNVNTIVFEYLGQMRIPKGFYGARRLRFKLHYWRKTGIQNKVTEMAHYLGMRISRVLARGTSMYAYDGTGKVSRSNRKDLCEFPEGKKYHADLNASYNIGARFFIRATIKPLSEKRRLALGAKVPEVLVRTEQTLSTLYKLQTCKA